jgi:hypothetical protein
MSVRLHTSFTRPAPLKKPHTCAPRASECDGGKYLVTYFSNEAVALAAHVA